MKPWLIGNHFHKIELSYLLIDLSRNAVPRALTEINELISRDRWLSAGVLSPETLFTIGRVHCDKCSISKRNIF